MQIFVNLPVKNVAASRAFFEAIGATINEQFSNEQAACVVFTDKIYAMILAHDFFSTFTPLPIADATSATEVLTCLMVESRIRVDDIVDKALAAGGTEPRAKQDLGFMYSRAFADLDGHMWEIGHMDMSQMPT